MLEWIVILLVAAAIAGLLGMRGAAGAATGVAKLLVFVVLIGFFLGLLLDVIVINV